MMQDFSVEMHIYKYIFLMQGVTLHLTLKLCLEIFKDRLGRYVKGQFIAVLRTSTNMGPIILSLNDTNNLPSRPIGGFCTVSDDQLTRLGAAFNARRARASFSTLLMLIADICKQQT